MRSAAIALRQTLPMAAILIALTACDAASANSVRNNGAANETVEQTTVRSPQTRDGYAEVEGGRIYYQLHGDLDVGKTPLLVLHGSLMSGEAMAPFVGPLAESRPVITIDARGHGRTGDLPGAITYEGMADDAAAVLEAVGVRNVDVFGYSMGGTTAILMAVRHPDLVGKQVILSAPAWRKGWYPQSQASFEQWNAEMFAGTPVERAYKRLSATPEAFPAVLDKLRELETANYDVAPAALRAIRGKTMIIAGDADGVQPAHALELFELRGGLDPKAATQGLLSEAPRARLAILPGTSHIGVMNEGELIARLVAPFLDDHPPPRPIGFFEGMDVSPDESEKSAAGER
jgi:pimeloyl-ACP methyl ester carboxylesterase